MASSVVKDINTTPSASTPRDQVTIGGITYFAASDDQYGEELWKTDGTAAGTVLVKDIYPGSNYSFPRDLVNVNGTLFFTAQDGTNGMELWKSDGTEAGTVLVKDIRPGSTSSAPQRLTNVGGVLYFHASEGTNGEELWKSDGTSAGTVLVKDIQSGSSGSSPRDFVDVNGTLFFTANDGTNGTELWKSNGTEAGTVMVKDINSGGSSSFASGLSNFSGTLVFYASDGSTGYELWKSDGTTAGTVLVKDINPGSGSSYPYYFAVFGGTLYFKAGDGSTGDELWKSDGTTAGTVMVKDINPGSSSSSPRDLIVVGGTLFFTASDGTNGSELWETDGTSAGTVMVKDINPGASSSSPTHFTDVSGTLFFAADDGTNGEELWKSDGSSAGTVLIKDIRPGSSGSNADYFASNGSNLIFQADDGTNGAELWKSDGTSAGTEMITDIRPGTDGAVSLLFGFSAVIGSTIYFSAYTDTYGSELWKSDGTAAGTVLVKDINPGTDGSNLSDLVNVGGTLFFSAYTPTNGTELWKSDGTEAGTVLVKDIQSGFWDSYPRYFVNVNGTLFFVADDGTNGEELWKSDGTDAGTVLVRDIYPGASPSYSYLYAGGVGTGTTLFFTADDGTNGTELWKTDGTTAGTVMVKDIYPGFANSNINYPEFIGGTLYFMAEDGVNGIELWKSDGTEAGTVMIKDINPGAGNSNPVDFFSFAGTIFFVATDGSTGFEFWTTDGTSAGTTLFKDINPGSASANVGSGLIIGGTLYFRATTATNGSELWKSDGTSAGTVLVKDIYPGTSSSTPVYFGNSGGTLVFAATDGTNGTELWTSDGTEAGTIFYDLYPGSFGSSPLDLQTVGAYLLFTANDPDYGYELWTYSPNEAPTLSGLAASVGFNENTVNAAPQTIDSDVTFADSDGGDLNSGILTVSYSVGSSAQDQLSIANQGVGAGQIGVSGSTVSFQGNTIGTITSNGVNGASLVVTFNSTSATPTAIDALIQALQYQNTSDNPTASRTIEITVSDGDGGTSSPATVAITVTAENDAPSLSNTAVVISAIIEDAAAPVGAVGTSLTSLAELAGGGGQNNVSDPDNAPQVGIAIIGANTANGSWLYSTNNGGNWSAMPAVSDSSALLLLADANHRVYFRPNADFFGTVNPALTFRAWDATSGSDGGTANSSVNGGSTAFSSATDTAAITVNSVNDAPSFTASNPAAVNEDAGDITINGWITNFSPGPANESGQGVQAYESSNWSNFGMFTTAPFVDPFGNLIFGLQPDANGTCTFDVRVIDNGGTANGGSDTSATQTFTVTVNAVNDRPSFTASNPPAVNEDAGAQTVSGWASGFSAGPANESAQTNLGYTVSNVSNAALFSAGPAVDVSGNLTYTPTAGMSGTSTFQVTVQDSGGTANGGVDTSNPQTFTITVNAVNDQPSFTAADPAAVNEDAGAQTVNGWVTAFDPGSAESGQTVSQYIVSNVSNAALFSAGPAVDASGNLSFTPAANANGTSTFDVAVQDNGGTANGGVDTSTAQTFTITVNAVNDAPTFTASNPAAVDEDASAQTVSGWASGFNPGPADESGQTNLGYAVSNVSNAALFSAGPAVDASGNLTFTPAANANGTSTFDVTVQDNGGTANGGADTSTAQTFTITVNAVNDAPVLADSAVTLDANYQGAPAPSGVVGTGVQTLVASVTDVDAGAVNGVAIVAANSTNGTWWYSLDNGGNWTAMPAVSASAALLLANNGSSRVYFQPSGAFFGAVDPGLTFRAWDQTSGTNGSTADVSANGGITAFSSATDTASIAVNAASNIAVRNAAATNIPISTIDNLAGTVPFGRAIVRTYTIANTGGAPLNLSGTPRVAISGTSNASASITVTPAATVASNASTVFDVTIVPTASGSFDVDFAIASNDPSKPSFDFSVAGTAGDTPHLAISCGGVAIANHATHDIGSAPMGSATGITFTATNSGQSLLTFDGTPIALADAFNATVAIGTDLPASLAASATADFTLDFTPSTAGYFSVEVTIGSDDPDHATFTVKVEGFATSGTAAEIVVERVPGVSLADGATVNVGTLTTGSPRDVSFTIRNAGSAALTLGTPAITGETNATATVTVDPVSASPLAPGGSTTLTVQVNPVADGAFSFAIALTNSDGDESPFDLTVAGTASATTAPEIRVYRADGSEVADAGTDSLGGVTVGEPLSVTYVIENAGNSALSLTGAALIGFTNATGHIVTAPATSVAAGATTTVGVELTPTQAGAISATLQIDSNDADENPFTVVIDSAGQVAKFELLRDGMLIGTSDSLASVTGGGAVHTVTYTVRNHGTGTLHLLTPPAVSDEHNVSVRINTPSWTELGPGETTTFDVSIDVLDSSSFSATVTMKVSDTSVGDNGTVTLTISGNGTDGTNIACGVTADPASLSLLGGWFIVGLVVFLALRRRPQLRSGI